MLCEDCKMQEANVHYKELINDQYRELHLCEECAGRRGLETVPFPSSPTLVNFLTGLAEIDKGVLPEEKTYECQRCHFSFSDFKEKGVLGCSHCYQIFEGQLVNMLQNIHGNIQHRGKTATKIRGETELREKILRLKKDLETAVSLEEFERAAQLRDQIKELESRYSDTK